MSIQRPVNKKQFFYENNEPVPDSIEGKVTGRPVTAFDDEIVKEFLRVQVPVVKIAAYFNVTPQTVYNHYGSLINKSITNFDHFVRAKQMDLAEAGDVKMLIHLGKTQLKQSEALPTLAEGEPEDKGVEFVIQAAVFDEPRAMTDSEREELDED